MAEKTPKQNPDEPVEETVVEPTEVVEEPAAEAVAPQDVPAADEAMVAQPDEEPPAAGADPASEAAEEAGTEAETVEASEVAERVADADASAIGNEPAAATEPAEADQPIAEVVEPEGEGQKVTSNEAGGAGPDADSTGEPSTDAGPAPSASAEPKRKRKRLPRALRPQKTRPHRDKASERKPIVRLPKPEGERGRRNELQGTVVSSAMDKTIVVKVDTIKAHRKYKKVVRRSAKFHAHDEANEAKAGDVVRIVETRPLSKTKNWRLAEIVEVAK